MSRVFKAEILERIYTQVIFGIVRTHGRESAVETAGALIEAGFSVLEVSMTTPGALDALRELTAGHPRALIGAGTVLDGLSARMAVDAGASFIVSPNLSEEVIITGSRYGLPVIPGVATPSEVVRAMEMGADVVKAFPGSVLGTGFIRALKGPIPRARVIPVGGVDASNLAEWIKAGAYALGLGRGLTHPGGTWEITEAFHRNARDFLALVNDEKDRRAGGRAGGAAGARADGRINGRADGRVGEAANRRTNHG